MRIQNRGLIFGSEHRQYQETEEHAVDLTQLVVGSDLCMFYCFYVFDYVSYE